MSYTGNTCGTQTPRLVVAGLDGVEEWIGVHGSIASGKSTLMARIRAYIDKHRQCAERADHIEPDKPDKVYYLLVEEPVDEWEKPRFATGGGELKSMLEMFYSDIEGLGFAFQVYAFNSRVERLTRRLACIAPAPFKRRIVLLSERTMRSDRVFFETVSKLNRAHRVKHAEEHKFIYDQFFSTICGDMLRHERRLIYVPTAPAVCAVRKQRRDREGESKCDEEYLARLDTEHRLMLEQFVAEQQGSAEAVIRLDDFSHELTQEQMDATVERLMTGLF
jgi:deoxyadenosine/deoxycytidine kinase